MVGVSAGEAACKKYLNEYPNCVYLKSVVAGLLNMYVIMSKDNSEEFMKENRKKF